MAQTDALAQAAFKKLFGLGHTEVFGFPIGNEDQPTSLTSIARDIYSESIPATAAETAGRIIDCTGASVGVHTALMQAAQSQADYMAATGQVTHTRPGGITFTQQLLNLGFPLAGDLSACGLRSENILSSDGPLAWNGVPPAWQDALHMTTMITASYAHIGAGVSQGSNRYYCAVDCAAATGSGEMQAEVAAALTSAPDSAGSSVSQYIVPVVVNTAQPDGNVFHVLQYGQTLWSVAIEYGTTIKEIQALNGLGDSLPVWQGQKLLVKRGATQPAPPTSTPTFGAQNTGCQMVRYVERLG